MRDKIKKHNQLDLQDGRNPNHVVSQRETDHGAVIVPLVFVDDSEGAKARSASYEMCNATGLMTFSRFENVSALQVKQLREFETPEISDALCGQTFSVKVLHHNACVGDMFVNKTTHLGSTGHSIDGLVRDLLRLREIDFPVCASGIAADGPLHREPGELCR